ncbi:MAG TPA: GGDEF domain-containing protein [Burkholderiales bacterium]|nr:GGDEF domain-containing protein [Burkholderiales bacterium]
MNSPRLPQEKGRRSGTEDRRKIVDRRTAPVGGGGVRHATWSEQKVQFITRYVFLALGVLFFNLAPEFKPTWMSLWQINAFFIVMALIIASIFWHASRNLYCVSRYRFAMWLDIVAVSICIANDPYEIPPSLIVFILVVLGNGMRYGMPFFAEAVIGSFLGGSVALVLRQMHSGLQIPPGMVFLTVFSAIVLVYAYILMGRIENSRKQLERSSNTDTLTGLMNRRALLVAAEALFDRVNQNDGRLVMLFADMDRFKSVNDGAGHAMGDQVLQKLGDILQDSIRGGDVAARYGGDEFVVLLNDASLDEGEQIARRIQALVQDFAREQCLDFGVTIALGEAPTHGTTIDALMDRVDEALYRSKSQRGAGGIGRAIAVSGS